MKKLNLIFALLFYSAMQGFAQNPLNNTTYGGVTQDASTNGIFTSNPSGSNNTGFGLNAFGNGTDPSGTDNTAMGYAAMPNPAGFGISGSFNSTLGSQSLYNITSGYQNSVLGYQAMYTNNVGWGNCAMGYQALFTNDAGWANTASGYWALYYNAGAGAAENTGIGADALICNTASGTVPGFQNTAVGGNCIFGNVTLGCGVNNTAEGYDALKVNYGNFNVATGVGALIANTSGFSNSAVGLRALGTNTTGSSNTALGYQADVANPAQTNTTAIGANAIINAPSNSMELGDNTVNVAIGMSNIPGGAANKLEISTVSAAAATPCNSGFISTFSTAPCTTQTGTSGLRFRDLTHASGAYTYQGNSGFLTVDDNGDVVLMQPPSVGGPLGFCYAPTVLAFQQGAYDLQTNKTNFYFEGQAGGVAGITDVVIGNAIGTCPPPNPPAKLNVFQHSQVTTGPSIGEYVFNNDHPFCSTTNITQPNVMGVQTILPATQQNSTSKVAGWFEADNSRNCCSNSINAPQYAIYVPRNGGHVAIGYRWNTILNGNPGYQTCPSSCLVDAWGTVCSFGVPLFSDSTLKTNVESIKGSNALSVIKKLQGVSYKFIDSVVTDSGVAGTHYGFIAQKVERILPNVVKTNPNNGIKSLAYVELIPWLVEGMKQQQQIIDKEGARNADLQKSVDSMRNALNNMQVCINKLCAASVQTNGTNSTTNVTDVNLSAAAILYQNAPNPFGQGGTKINYFLPEGTMGASLVFYDSYGTKLKEVELTQTGMGTVNVNPAQLTTGMYTYSLVINGNVVDTKKMVFAK